MPVLSGLDALVIAMAVPKIQSSLNATVSQLQWAADAYTLAFGGLLLLAGSLADRFGHKLVLLTGLVVMLGFSLGAAFSGSASTLIVCRAGMGVGAAMVMPATLAIIKYVFPPEEQTKAIGIWSGAAGLGIPLGPVVGGLLLNHFWWGSIFLINVPVVVIALTGGFALIPVWRSEKRVGLDLVGAVLAVAGLIILVYGLIEAPNNGWGSATTLGCVIGGIAAVIAFVLWESRVSNAMLPVDLFRNRVFSGSAFALTCQAFALFGSLFVLTQYFQDARHEGPLAAGLRMLAICTLIISSPLAPRVVESIGAKLTIIIGLLIIAAGAFTLSTAAVDNETLVLISLGVMGFGIGLSIPPSVDGILGSAPEQHAGTASAVNDTALQLGGAIGVAVLGSVMTASYRGALPSLSNLPVAAQQGARNSLGSALQVAGHLGHSGQGLIAEATHAFGSGLDAAAMTSAWVAIAGAIATVFIMPRRIKTAVPAAGTGGTPVPADAAGPAESAESGLASKLSE
jgi:EmrB/QacA subfamily drug resistance transporter